MSILVRTLDDGRFHLWLSDRLTAEVRPAALSGVAGVL